jgi:hypothetical protein
MLVSFQLAVWNALALPSLRGLENLVRSQSANCFGTAMKQRANCGLAVFACRCDFIQVHADVLLLNNVPLLADLNPLIK